MSEISSGLVAVAEVGSGFSICWTEPDYGGSCKPYDMLVRLSDAEAIIAAKDAEIARLFKDRGIEHDLANRFGFENNDLRSKVAKQAAALKLAREALFDMQDSYAAVHGWKDSFVIAATTAIAAIDSLQKGE